MVAKLKVAYHRTIRSAAKRSIFVFVDLLEEGRLVKFEGSFEIFQELFLSNAHHTYLELGPGERVLDQVVETAPRTFEFLKIFVVHDLVHLGRNQAVDLCDASIDRHIHILGHGQFAAHYLIDELSDHVFCAFFLKIVTRHFAVSQDLVEQADFASGFDGFYCGFFSFLCSHFRLVLLRIDTERRAQFFLFVGT